MLEGLQQVFFELLGYQVSYMEFIATMAGLVCVFLAAKNNILTWPVGIINIITSFVIFYQVALYSDMFLQIYFFATAIYGWMYWNKQKEVVKKVTTLNLKQRLTTAIILVFGTLMFGYFISQIHLYFPDTYSFPAAFPYADTLVAVASIVANYLMAQRRLENWILWIAIDILACYLYFAKGIKFIAFEYIVFIALAAFGLYQWWQEQRSYDKA
jgi:nicotinamide mononucleotide transporter